MTQITASQYPATMPDTRGADTRGSASLGSPRELGRPSSELSGSKARGVTRDALLDFLVERQGLDRAELTDQTLLFTGGLLDSFTLVDLMQFLEEEGGFEMSTTEAVLENLDSIERILAYAASRG